MAGTTSRRKVANTRRRSRSQARRRRSFKVSIPANWGRPAGAARRERPQLHAISWRTQLKAIFVALVGSARWISLLLLVGVGGALYAVGAEGSFYISDIEVQGNTTLAPAALASTSGMAGQHIFWVNPAEAAHRVADIPSVMTATVEISWPNQARITVSERAPVMVWDQAGDRFWVDERGRLMQARQYASDLLVVFSQETGRRQIGERLPAEVVAGAIQLRQERPNIDILHYEFGPGLSYQDGRNWRVYFGTGLDMNQKLVVYEALVDDLVARNLQPKYISVVNKEKPFYRLVVAGD